MKTGQIRKAFLDYFGGQGHTIVPSSSLVPHNDSTLLFTNAGMVQFKDTFTGVEKRSYTQAVSSQRCVRAGGKHNDLENVGYTARHHTFFEMLGNFSFGGYFKREAIQYAWNFLTQILKLPPERLWITVYEKDDEAADIWLNEIKIDKNKFSRCGDKDNFWSMGDTGPCGPCTEIFYDHGPNVPGGPPGSRESEGDRFIEVWNLVFMQYNRAQDGQLTLLPKPSVDTGMGLERIAAVMQGVHSNYDIDIFKYLIDAITTLGKISDRGNQSLRVIADHIRACSFLILDGVVPSNEGRGYVLRRICRRAIRHGHRLGFETSFFHKLVKPLADIMADAYPELAASQAQVERILHQEEQQFARTLDQGLKILEQDISGIAGRVIPGETVFRLYDTYGFPIDLTNDIARERGLELDIDGFNEAMAKQRTRARESSQFTMAMANAIDIPHKTDFTGYETLEDKDYVIGLYHQGKACSELTEGEEGGVVLSHTPFYAESGGQVGDNGVLYFEEGEFEIQNTRKVKQAYLHVGFVKKGTLTINQMVQAVVDKKKRLATALNHSATHLLHAALRQLLGPHVQQKGSLVDSERLRFDFTHFEPVTAEQIRILERLVNDHIRLNTEAHTEVMPVEQALQSGAMALFGEKYGESVRVLRMGHDFSVELCGGTHIKRTGDIGLFKITAEGGVAAGIRRLEAITGKKAMTFIENLQINIDTVAALLKCNREGIEEKIQQILNKSHKQEKELQTLKLQMVSGGGQGPDLSEQARTIGGIKVLAIEISLNDPKSLREMVDRLKDKLKTAVIVLAAVNEGKVSLVVGVTNDITAKLKAGELVNHVASLVGGQGGGRADMAQAGGNNPSALEEALSSVYGWVENQLSNV
jgi:alanyl-tRNA synthetase